LSKTEAIYAGLPALLHNESICSNFPAFITRIFAWCDF